MKETNDDQPDATTLPYQRSETPGARRARRYRQRIALGRLTYRVEVDADLIEKMQDAGWLSDAGEDDPPAARATRSRDSDATAGLLAAKDGG